MIRLDDILFSQGFGTRRVCAGLVQTGFVQVQRDEDATWLTVKDSATMLKARQGLCLRVQGEVWQYQEKAYLMMHKPMGVECSQKPSAYPSIYTLLPAPLRQRPVKSAKPGVQAIGRLDQDTTGLILLSDDGQFIHRLSSPKQHIAKVYEIQAQNPITQKQIERLKAGVVLRDDSKPVWADDCELLAENCLRMTLHAGKYHQVKRMLAAVGNQVLALHRSQIGDLVLPNDLALGAWRWLTLKDIKKLVPSFQKNV